MLRSLMLLTALVVLLGPIETYAGDFSEEIKSAKYHVWPTIPFIRAGNLQAFKEAFGRSRSDQRWEMIDQAVELMDAGAYGEEALKIVLAFDEQISRRRSQAMDRIGESIQGYFAAHLDNLYRRYKPQTQLLGFKQIVPPIDVVGDALAGELPWRVDEEALTKVNYIAYGTYSNHYKGMAQLHIVLYVVNVRTGVTRILKGEGEPDVAAAQIARQLFDLFQKTQFPSKIKMGQSGVLKLISHDQIASRYSTLISKSYIFAEAACEDVGGRLPQEREFLSIARAGDYNGGVTVEARDRREYYWAIKGKRIYDATSRTVFPAHHMNKHPVLQYICVE